MSTSICVTCLDVGSGEQLKIILQLSPLNRGIQMEKCPAPSTKQSMAALSFYNEQECTQAITRQNDAELVHLFMQRNCLEPLLVLEVYCTVALVDSEHVTAERNLSVHLIHPLHFSVEKTRPRVGKTQRYQVTESELEPGRSVS